VGSDEERAARPAAVYPWEVTRPNGEDEDDASSAHVDVPSVIMKAGPAPSASEDEDESGQDDTTTLQRALERPDDDPTLDAPTLTVRDSAAPSNDGAAPSNDAAKMSANDAPLEKPSPDIEPGAVARLPAKRPSLRGVSPLAVFVVTFLATTAVLGAVLSVRFLGGRGAPASSPAGSSTPHTPVSKGTAVAAVPPVSASPVSVGPPVAPVPAVALSPVASGTAASDAAMLDASASAASTPSSSASGRTRLRPNGPRHRPGVARPRP
jgi:hypothetical protein